MIIGIFTLIGVLLGFYLAKYSEINKKVADVIIEAKKKLDEVKQPGYAEDMVVSTNEAELEASQNAAKEAEMAEKIDIKDILK